MMQAIVFAILDCGFTPRCALEIGDSSQIRIDRIFRIIEECKFAIHDLSRTQLDRKTRLPRFNMPLELGIFLGAKRFGNTKQRSKCCIVLDVERYRYQKFISDISGQDIEAHKNEPKDAVNCIRNWLRSASKRENIPGGAAIWGRYRQFKAAIPKICREARLKQNEMTFPDLTNAAGLWLERTAPIV